MKNKLETLIALAILTAISFTAYAGITTVAVGTSETTVLDASQQRRWIVLQNNSTNDIFVKIDSSTNAVTSSNGLKVPSSGGTLSLSLPSAPVGNTIKAISGIGTNNLRVQYGNEG
jgi:hypothetical protein